MKFSQITTYFVIVFLCFNSIIAQQNTLSIIPTGIYEIGKKSSIQEAIDTDNHNTLLAALKATSIEDALGENIPFTIFAPSDNAFSKFSQQKLQELLKADDKRKLESLLKYHIVAGKLTASKILRALCEGKGRTTFTTIQGNKITATMDGIDIVLTDPVGNSARITVADATNGVGVMHEIDTVILPSRI